MALEHLDFLRLEITLAMYRAAAGKGRTHESTKCSSGCFVTIVSMHVKKAVFLINIAHSARMYLRLEWNIALTATCRFEGTNRRRPAPTRPCQQKGSSMK